MYINYDVNRLANVCLDNSGKVTDLNILIRDPKVNRCGRESQEPPGERAFDVHLSLNSFLALSLNLATSDK